LSCASQLSGGLSSEYTGDVRAGAELIKQPHSEVSRRYYVSQLLREGELALHQTWRKVSAMKRASVCSSVVALWLCVILRSSTYNALFSKFFEGVE
jgi:hypothetical protein